jgi:methylenetetrahydrofolate--tRNA-(uracil-5-)-methyltransferase
VTLPSVLLPPPSKQPPIHIVGAGLAGAEAALQLADADYQITLYDIKPDTRSAAHHRPALAEIVCSNSMGSQNLDGNVSASGLLKEEMAALGSRLLSIAQETSLPAGKALAVDRERFSDVVTQHVQAHANINFVCQDVTELPSDDPQAIILIATGPLTSPGLSATLAALLGRDQLYFFDAAAPIVARDSIDFDIAFLQDRYAVDRDALKEEAALAEATGLNPENAEEERDAPAGSYINCPLDKPEYERLNTLMVEGEKTELKDFEKESAQYFESCLPVEVLASRGVQTLRYGPMKPVGIVDPRTNRWPYAVVQLRQDNSEATLYNLVGFQTNLKWGAQKEMIQAIPGLANADIVRYGVMHRNTFIHAPETLEPTLQLKRNPNILLAGQLTGTEGYTESIASGSMAAINIARLANGQSTTTPPPETMLGSLLRYITRPEAIGHAFQPINSNWGIMPPLPEGSFPRKDKKARNRLYQERALTALKTWQAFETH